MRPRTLTKGPAQVASRTTCAAVRAQTPAQDYAAVRAEIKRLKRELAQAREELETLTEATSDFVRLML
jgi:transposase-like protein